MEASVRTSGLIALSVIALLLPCSAVGPNVRLSATSLDPAPYTPFFGVNQSSLDIGDLYLPSCVVQSSQGMSYLLQLRNNDTGVVINQVTGVNLGQVTWDHVNHPTITPEYAGNYQCVANDSVSSETYRLSVVVPISVYPLPAITRAVYSADEQNLTCRGKGFQQISPSVTSLGEEVISTSMSVTEQSRGIFLGETRVTFAGNASVAQADESFVVHCTHRYTSFTCSPTQNSTARDGCMALTTSANTSTEVHVYADMPTTEPQPISSTTVPATTTGTTVMPVTTTSGASSLTSGLGVVAMAVLISKLL